MRARVNKKYVLWSRFKRLKANWAFNFFAHLILFLTSQKNEFARTRGKSLKHAFDLLLLAGAVFFLFLLTWPIYFNPTKAHLLMAFIFQYCFGFIGHCFKAAFKAIFGACFKQIEKICMKTFCCCCKSNDAIGMTSQKVKKYDSFIFIDILDEHEMKPLYQRASKYVRLIYFLFFRLILIY